MTGTPLEPSRPSYDSDVHSGVINYHGMVKQRRIGKSAAKYLFEIKVQRLVDCDVHCKQMAMEMGNIIKDEDIVYSCAKAQAVHRRTSQGVASLVE